MWSGERNKIVAYDAHIKLTHVPCDPEHVM